jgi:aryl-alcohol dehydrogenase-like predicted oxidoreductase
VDQERRSGVQPGKHSHRFVASSIVRSTTFAQLREAIEACSVTLADEVRKEIEAQHLRFSNPAP